MVKHGFFRFAWTVPLAALIGCGSSSEPGTPPRVRVAFVTNTPHEFWTYAERGCEKAAREFGVDVLFRRPPQGTAVEQQRIVEDLLLKGVGGIAVSPSDAKNQVEFFNQVAGKVPLVTQDSDLPAGSKRLCYLGTDNYGAGRAAGRMVKEAMPDGGRVLVLVGSLDVQNAQDRRRGLLDELAGTSGATGPQFGKYELIDTYTDGGDQAACKAKVDAFLVKSTDDPTRLCLVGLWAYNPPAALEAAKNAGLAGKVKLVAFDEHEQTLAAVESGEIVGTVVQQPFEFGYEAVKLLAALARGDRSSLPPDGVKPIPFDVVRRDGVAAFREKLKQLLTPAGG